MTDDTAANSNHMGGGKPSAVGFPAPLLGAENLRLKVLYMDKDLLALERGPNLLAGPHPWHPELPVLSEALNTQLAAGKPELLRLGLDPKKRVEPVFHVDPGVAGVAIFALGAKAATKARNAFGSCQWTMRFQLLAVGGPESGEAVCSQPVARHNALPMALVSTTTGKKTETHFKRLETFGKYALWEAETSYYRADQLPVHAAELGIDICGELFYCRETHVYLSQIKRKWEGDPETEKPLYESPAAWLECLILEDGTEIHAEPPARLANAIRQVRRFCS
jgi:23S rRNA-/tRNA-specific pseudouridylate synthase